MIRRLLAIAFAAAPLAWADRPALIPYPRSIEWGATTARVSGFSIEAPAEAGYAPEAARAAFGPPGDHPIELVLDPSINGHEAYTLETKPAGVIARASTPAGLFYAVTTLRQLARKDGDRWALPAVSIADHPAFAWRGFMHDTGRNPQEVEWIKRFIDRMAAYKMNVFHWHLTDYPGYRIECRVHPELNDPQFMTRQPGFFYTYDQIREVLAFARARGVEVFPEIDMPGHSDYFKRAFGFDMQDPRGVKILEAVLDEFMREIKTPALHIGSDEVQLRNKTFLNHFAQRVRDTGREVAVWRPGGLPAGRVITHAWSAGTKPNAPLEGLPYLDSRHNYVNHLDPFDAATRLLHLDPCERAEGDEWNLGAILCHWPDLHTPRTIDIYRQSPVMPALVAAAEQYWRGGKTQDKRYWGRIPDTNETAFARFADFEARMLARRDLDFEDWPFPYVRQTHIPWRLVGPATWSEAQRTPVDVLQETYEVGGKTIGWMPARGATIHLQHFWYDGWIPKGPTGTVYAVTEIYSPVDQMVPFWIGFDEPSRSDRRAPNAPEGKWNHSGARIWIAGREIPPPTWKQPMLGKADSETPMLDEGYFYRPPVEVALRKGWNTVLIEAPHKAPDWKWMFTCVPVRLEGDRVREFEGLEFRAPVWGGQ